MSMRRVPFSRAFWALWATSVFVWTGMLLPPFLTLYFSDGLGYSPAASGLLFSIYGLGGFSSGFVAGPLIDRYGGKSVLCGSLVLTSGCVLVMLSMSTLSAAFYALLFFFGLSSMSVQPATTSLVVAYAPASQLRRAYSILFIGSNIGFAIGPAMGGLIAAISFSLLFYGQAAFSILAAVISFIMLPKTSWRGLPDDSIATNPSRAFKSPFKHGAFLGFVALNVAFMIIYMQSQSTLPLVMASEGMPPSSYGLVLGINGGLLVIGQLGADRITARWRLPNLLVLGTVIVGFGFLLYSISGKLWIVALGAVVWTIGEMFNMPVTNSIAALLAPKGLAGRYLAIVNMSFPMGSVIGPAVGGMVLESLGARGLWITVFAAAVGVAGLRALNARWLKKI